MLELQALGAALVDLPESQLALLSPDAALPAAVREAKRIRSHEARPRQMQSIGGGAPRGCGCASLRARRRAERRRATATRAAIPADRRAPRRAPAARASPASVSSC